MQYGESLFDEISTEYKNVQPYEICHVFLLVGLNDGYIRHVLHYSYLYV